MSKTSCLLIAGALTLLLATAGCADTDESIAVFEHDLSGKKTLYAFAPVPLEEKAQADHLAKGMYGIETKSPRTPYICVWRDTSHVGLRGGPTKPGSIFLTCAFGTSAWTPPPGLVAQAEERSRRDEGVIRITWDQDGASYRITRFEVDIRDVSGGKKFRSIHFGKEVEDVSLTQGKTVFPTSESEPFVFSISASAPFRQNKGDMTGDPIAQLTIIGTAVPMPKWVLY